MSAAETSEHELYPLRLVRLTQAAKIVGRIRTKELRRLMADRGLPLIELSERRRFITFGHLIQLIDGLAKHPHGDSQ